MNNSMLQPAMQRRIMTTTRSVMAELMPYVLDGTTVKELRAMALDQITNLVNSGWKEYWDNESHRY